MRLATDVFSPVEIDVMVATHFPDWEWVDAIPGGVDSHSGAVRLKIHKDWPNGGAVRTYVWLFPDGHFEPDTITVEEPTPGTLREPL